MRGLAQLVSHSARAESHVTRLDDQEYIAAWKASPIFHKYAGQLVKHTAATDDTSQISALASGILDWARPSYIGRDLVRRYETDKEFYTIRLPEEGKAVQTDEDTWSINTKGERNTYIKIEPRKQFVVGDEWNRTFIENADYDVLNSQLQNCTASMMKLETQIILGKFKELEAAGESSNIAGKVARGASDTMTVNIMVQLCGKLASKDRMARVLACHPDTLYEVLQTEEAQRSEYFKDMIDWNGNEGFVGRFLGSRMMTSTLMTRNKMYAIDTEVVLPMVFVRDNYITPWSDNKNDLHGIRISSRYGLEFGRKDGFAWWG